ncbi:triphosphoribosyl-dephospho-CoA synthase CitG [Companilactobacillus halodurans]|uniref:Probable 2-(5''-triphosphoribosyl)-3'-dephosphocoenzyme-A synthase n=1 Tax=Companilactobacillus halodurans TaxID=2584183 RepID=A0A5P0ZZL1_9LACO|nr:triphosphoribosyl-dephospho-CoA synthase CitG [Companilactobacillus halodurans]MQS76578.1 triphosphoribosyl-dephospho-CoA synthase CitG [Companilactobacillus halodurans]MQS98218.1 triphosphoribosyl-dephospho-CoA synthase CitG [Companilactobacillus halodurans]
MKLSTHLADAALKALLYEVDVQPKPGLVDPVDHSTHLDMDVFTFIDSAVSLRPYLEQFAQAGVDFEGEDLTKLFASIRKIGVKAEKAMFEATGEINTHKGAIFSLGILLAATGYDQDNTRVITERMLRGLTENDFKDLDKKKNLTNGEKMFLQYGVTGIRGEAERGYPIVFEKSLPFLKAHFGNDFNNVLLDTLMVIVSESYDSNVVKRGNLESLKNVQKYAQDILEAGGCSNPDGREILDDMNSYCNENNLSLGGSADLLIITVFLFLI